MAAVAGVRLPELQLRHGHLPLHPRPLRRRLRRRRLPGPHPPLPLPPPAGAQRPRPPGLEAQGRRLGPRHPPHAHVLLQGRRHHAALGTGPRLGHGDPHHWSRVLRLLRRPTGGAMIRPFIWMLGALPFPSFVVFGFVRHLKKLCESTRMEDP